MLTYCFLSLLWEAGSRNNYPNPTHPRNCTEALHLQHMLFHVSVCWYTTVAAVLPVCHFFLGGYTTDAKWHLNRDTVLFPDTVIQSFSYFSAFFWYRFESMKLKIKFYVTAGFFIFHWSLYVIFVTETKQVS